MDKVFETIQSNIDWRLAEFNSIEGVLLVLDGKQQKIFLRNTVPAIYAHWEGFVVSSIEIVFVYLNELGLTNQDYCYTYLTTAYEQTLKSLEDSSEFDKRKKHLTTLYDKFGNTVSFTGRIDTKSNLGFTVLTEICKKTNLKIASFEDYKLDLNKLLNIRNSIAHGENSHVFEKFNDIEKYISLLENLMLTFKNEIQYLLENEKYRKEII